MVRRRIQRSRFSCAKIASTHPCTVGCSRTQWHSRQAIPTHPSLCGTSHVQAQRAPVPALCIYLTGRWHSRRGIGWHCARCTTTPVPPASMASTTCVPSCRCVRTPPCACCKWQTGSLGSGLPPALSDLEIRSDAGVCVAYLTYMEVCPAG